MVCKTTAVLMGLLTGFFISGVAVRSASAQGTDLTFKDDIFPIFRDNCNRCHHSGGPTDQSYETYKKARPWLRSAKKSILNKTMPPWQAGESVGEWKNARPLAEADGRKLIEWIDNHDKAKEKAADEPPKVEYPQPWKIGTPDTVFQMSEPYEIPYENDDYRAFVLEPAFQEDTWLKAIEPAPDQMDMIADMWVSAAPTAAARAADKADEGPGFSAFDGGWAEGTLDFLAVWNRGMTRVESLPKGTGFMIPRDHSLVLHIHYNTFGEEEIEDQSRVGIYIAGTPPARAMKTASVENRAIRIPADATEHVETAELKLAKAVKIHHFFPRMHYLGKQMKLEAIKPDGTREPLIEITGYLYNIQTLYTAAKPIALPAGTTLKATAVYDNSEDNENNPNESIEDAAYGPGPAGEILSVVIHYTED